MQDAFQAAHKARFGFMDETKALVVEAVEVEAVGGGARFEEEAAAENAGEPKVAEHTRFFSKGQWHEAAIVRREAMAPGQAIAGPAIVIEPNQTVVVYMGVGALAQICGGLVEHGLPASLPAALVEKATLPEQRVTEGTLATLPGLASGAKPPALLIVGEVVRLRAKLAWFGTAKSGTDHVFS